MLNHTEPTLQDTVIVHTPCMETGIYPHCKKLKGKCELEGYAKQTPEMCITPSLLVQADSKSIRLGFPYPKRPLEILQAIREGSFKAQSGQKWKKCLRHNIQITGCSHNFECERCISEAEREKSLTKQGMNIPAFERTTRTNSYAPITTHIRKSLTMNLVR